MSEARRVSRRTSLRSIGAIGAALAVGGPAAAACRAAGAGDVADGQEKPAASAPEVAVSRFTKGHSWAQAVFSAVAEQLGMDYQTALKVSAGFGGGMYLGSVCGAVTGGIMAIGLKHGGLGPASKQTALVVRDFADRFRAQHKAINCPDLTGFDLAKVDLRNPETAKKVFGDMSTPEAQQKAREMLGGRDPKEIFAACTRYVRDAAAMVTELTSEPVKG